MFSFRDITDQKDVERKLADYQRRLRSLASELSLAEERERRRIATHLHDCIGQTLLVSKMKLSTLLESESCPGLAGSLGEIIEMIEQTIQNVRSLTFELGPPMLYMLGLESAVEWLVEQNEIQHGIMSEFEDDGESKPLDDDLRVELFQNVRELLINVTKHSRATRVKVSIRRNGSAVNVSVEDDGVGFDNSKVGSQWDGADGFGLFSIRERLRHFGGHFYVYSRPGYGTRVTLVAPLKTDEATTSKEVI